MMKFDKEGNAVEETTVSQSTTKSEAETGDTTGQTGVTEVTTTGPVANATGTVADDKKNVGSDATYIQNISDEAAKLNPGTDYAELFNDYLDKQTKAYDEEIAKLHQEPAVSWNTDQAKIGEGYYGKTLKQNMKDNPTMRAVDILRAENEYRKSKGVDPISEYEWASMLSGIDPNKSRNDIKKDRRKMLWAEGINGIADVLQKVVNFGTASKNDVHDAAATTEYNRQLRKRLDDTRIQNLENLMKGIKEDNAARKAAIQKRQDKIDALTMKKLENYSPSVQMQLIKLLQDQGSKGYEILKLIEEINNKRQDTINEKTKTDNDTRKTNSTIATNKSTRNANDTQNRYRESLIRKTNADAEGKEIENELIRGGSR